jgi:hypothetical protein
MITVNETQIPNLVSEMTLKQYEWVSAMLNNKNLDAIEKHIKVFTFFGVSEEYLNDLSFDEFKNLIKLFSESKPANLDFQKEFELNGYTYRAFDDEFKLKVKDMKQIEVAFKQEKYLCTLMAIIFKRTDLTDKEHYDKAHIKQKAKLFGDLKAEFSIPYLVKIGQVFQEQYDKAKELESTES